MTEFSSEDEPALRRHDFLFEACHSIKVISSRNFKDFLRNQLVEKAQAWFRKSKVMEERRREALVHIKMSKSTFQSSLRSLTGRTFTTLNPRNRRLSGEKNYICVTSIRWKSRKNPKGKLTSRAVRWATLYKSLVGAEVPCLFKQKLKGNPVCTGGQGSYASISDISCLSLSLLLWKCKNDKSC